MKIRKICVLLILPASFAWACGSSSSGENAGAGAAAAGTNTGTGGSAALGGEGVALGGDGLVLGHDQAGAATSAGTRSTGGSGSGNVSGSGGVMATGTTQCSDGKDNDGDGLVDELDPECTGPGDNDEGSFATGIPGDNRDPKWQDCFFDGNSGAGDDGCRYATGCLTGALKPTDKDCQLSAACIKFCAPLVPNGCDCFGCCTVQLPTGATLDVDTVATCSLDKIDDTKACPRCVKNDACGNTCGHCELCPGKTLADLPADCVPTGAGGAGSGAGGAGAGTGPGTGGGPAYTCDNGEQVCSAELHCALGTYCTLGCCIELPPR